MFPGNIGKNSVALYFEELDRITILEATDLRKFKEFNLMIRLCSMNKMSER